MAPKSYNLVYLLSLMMHWVFTPVLAWELSCPKINGGKRDTLHFSSDHTVSLPRLTFSCSMGSLKRSFQIYSDSWSRVWALFLPNLHSCDPQPEWYPSIKFLHSLRTQLGHLRPNPSLCLCVGQIIFQRHIFLCQYFQTTCSSSQFPWPTFVFSLFLPREAMCTG